MYIQAYVPTRRGTIAFCSFVVIYITRTQWYIIYYTILLWRIIERWVYECRTDVSAIIIMFSSLSYCYCKIHVCYTYIGTYVSSKDIMRVDKGTQYSHLQGYGPVSLDLHIIFIKANPLIIHITHINIKSIIKLYNRAKYAPLSSTDTIPYINNIPYRHDTCVHNTFNSLNSQQF